MRIRWLLCHMEAQKGLPEKESSGARVSLIIPVSNR